MAIHQLGLWRALLRRFPWVGAPLAAVLLLAACATPPAVSYTRVSFADLPGWEQDDLKDFATAWRRSCAIAPPRWRAVCAQQPTLDADWRTYLMNNFTPWQVTTRAGDTGLFTGYYVPEFAASLQRQGRYTTPIYGLPRDLVLADLGAFKPELRGQRLTGRVAQGRFVPYPDRARITAQGIAAPVLAWAADPLEVFIMQVQGSGQIRLPGGRMLELGYAGQNGHPYVAIGKVLKEQGAFPDGRVTMPRIRAWLADHPEQQAALFNRNPSYVFFRPLKGGAQGAQGVALTPTRSLAVDPAFTRLGAPVWLAAEHPDGGALQRLLVAQDTGGAIKGPIRGDVFWGYGEVAAQRAGVMQSQGLLYVLYPNGEQPEAGTRAHDE
jgi:membrane-bound lytic murein transglycosylase A